MDNKEIRSKGPEDSELGMEVAPTCLKCQELEAELERWKDATRHWMWMAADAAGEDLPDKFYNF